MSDELRHSTVTLKIKIYDNAQAQASLDELKIHLQNELTDWSDGRYGLHREAIDYHLSKAIEKAIWQVLRKKMWEQYGSEIVTSADGRSQTPKAILEREKLFHELRLTADGVGDIEVYIEPWQEK